MKRHHDLADQRVRRLPLHDDDQALLESGSDARTALFDAIVAMPLDGQATERRRPRATRRAVVLVAILALMSVAAVGWALLGGSGQTTTAACHTQGDPNSGVGIDLVTGDPLVDCAAIWERETGATPPPLAAYDNGTGGIAVMPAEAEVPDGWQPLTPGTAQDPRIIELQVGLDDHIAGLHSACHPSDAGRAIAQRELDRLELTGWTVATERGEADGTTTCSRFHLDPERPQVVITPGDGPTQPVDAPYHVFARELGAAIDGRCLPVSEAADLARHIAAAADIPDGGLVINEVVDEDATCARVHVTVAGVIETHVRGPHEAG